MPELNELTEDVLRPMTYLRELLKTPEDVRRMGQRLRDLWAPFPVSGEVLFVHYALFLAGLETPYAADLESMVRGMVKSGWRALPLKMRPCPGDVYISGPDDGYKSMGFVCGAASWERGRVLGLDSHHTESGRPFPVHVNDVRYFLRLGGG